MSDLQGFANAALEIVLQVLSNMCKLVSLMQGTQVMQGWSWLSNSCLISGAEMEMIEPNVAKPPVQPGVKQSSGRTS